LREEKEAKPVQSSIDLGGGDFCFRKKENIRRMIPDQSPQSANCSRPSKPPAVPSKNPHYCWRGFTKPPLLVESRTDVENSETIFFLPFLDALKMALAGTFSKEPGLKTGGWRKVYREEPQSL
jgi:hypothetical protein